MASAVTPHPLTHTMHSNSFGLAIVLRNDVRGWPTPPWVRAQAPPRRRPPPPEGASHGLELTAPGSRPAARQASTMPSNLLEDVEHLDATESMPDASVPDDERHRAVDKAKACQKRDTICSPKAKARAPPRQSFRDGAPMPVCLPPAKRKKSGQSTSSLAGKSSSSPRKRKPPTQMTPPASDDDVYDDDFEEEFGGSPPPPKTKKTRETVAL